MENKSIGMEKRNSFENGNTKKSIIEKKKNKRIAKAVNVILQHENKSAEEIFSEHPTLNLWCYHFGNGDEEDQIRIKNYFEKNFGEGVKVIIYPGISYGLIQLNSLDIADAIIKHRLIIENENAVRGTPESNATSLNNHDHGVEKKENNLDLNKITKKPQLDSQAETKNKKPKHINIKAFCHTIGFESGERTIISIFSKIAADMVEQSKICNFPNAQYRVDVPGVYLIENFVTEKEEAELMEGIDKNNWEKLAKRGVQHYGYEFIYGENAVNHANKIASIPAFCDKIMKGKLKNKYYN